MEGIGARYSTDDRPFEEIGHLTQLKLQGLECWSVREAREKQEMGKREAREMCVLKQRPEAEARHRGKK